MDYLGYGEMTLRKKTWIYAANNENGFLCARELARQGFQPKMLLLHPFENSKYRDEIRSVFPDSPVIEWTLKNFNTEMEADILLSVNFGYVFPSDFLSRFPAPVNLHTGLLPYNRGSHPNVWSIYENTPAGVTLHFMTSNIDKGSIISQKEVPVSLTETGKSLYKKLMEASVSLIGESFSLLLEEEIPSFPMPEGGTFHLSRDFEDLCSISTGELMDTDAFIRRLQALSFPPYKNAYFINGGKRIFIDINLSEENE